MDSIDKHILERLATDGRYKFTQLAMELNLSEAAIRVRVRHLQDTGVVQIVALCNPLIMGHRGVRIIVGLDGPCSRGTMDEFDAISQINQLSLIDDKTGVYIDLTCRDLNQLVDVLDTIRSIQQVNSIKSAVLTRLFKDYSWHGLIGSHGQDFSSRN